MRSLLIASAGVALLTAGAADAQRMVAHGPGASFPQPGMSGQPAMGMRPPMAPRPAMAPRPPMAPRQMGHQPRWGSKVGGHWYAGMNAPGGWRGYSRPYRGWSLPSYWVSPSFLISDWGTYGLAQPPYGYSWSRYYDDAVLIDGRGSVYDSVSDVDWDRYDRGVGYADQGEDVGYDDSVYAGPDDRSYAPPPPPRYERRDNGVGGAVTGAVVGGVAGNLIAGRGNRLGGTLIGAGVGAAAGYAIDKNEDRGRYGDRGRYEDRGRYDAPPPPPPPPPPHPTYAPGASYAPPAPYYPPVQPGRPANWVSPDGRTSVVTTTSGGYYGTGVTTVTVQTAPVITTTTEVFEDTVTYSRPKKVYRKHVWRPRPKCGCR